MYLKSATQQMLISVLQPGSKKLKIMLTGNINDLIVYDRIKKQQLYKEDRFHVMLLSMQQGISKTASIK